MTPTRWAPNCRVAGRSWNRVSTTLFRGHANAAARLAFTLNRLAELLIEAGDESAAGKARQDAAECRERFKLPVIG